MSEFDSDSEDIDDDQAGTVQKPIIIDDIDSSLTSPSTSPLPSGTNKLVRRYGKLEKPAAKPLAKITNKSPVKVVPRNHFRYVTLQRGVEDL